MIYLQSFPALAQDAFHVLLFKLFDLISDHAPERRFWIVLFLVF